MVVPLSWGICSVSHIVLINWWILFHNFLPPYLTNSEVTESFPGVLLFFKFRMTKKNKLLVHMYIVKNTTIFLIVRLLLLRYNYMFRPSILAIFRLYMKHLTINYIYTWVGVQFEGWGGCEISFCVCRRGVDRVYLGVLLKYLSCLLLTISIGYIFDDVLSYIGNYINMDYV